MSDQQDTDKSPILSYRSNDYTLRQTFHGKKNFFLAFYLSRWTMQENLQLPGRNFDIGNWKTFAANTCIYCHEFASRKDFCSAGNRGL